MSDSILTSVKKGIGGIIEEDEAFDDELIMHINSTLSKLTQIGVGPKAGFQIQDKTATWSDFIGNDCRLNMIRTYVVCDVRLIFAPPTVGAVVRALSDRVSALEWRLNVQAETVDSEPTPDPESE